MTTQEYLDGWHEDGRITGDQHDVLSALVSRRRVSLFLELTVLMYLGVLAIAGGLAWTVSAYGREWGDLAVLVPTTALLVACTQYCVRHLPPYSTAQVAAPTLAFDYLLYLACLTFAVELGYVEYRFQLLQGQWDAYVLASSLLYFIVAYRCDNRLVLSLAIGTLGAWFGIRVSRVDFFPASQLRAAALGYGALTAAVGTALYRAGIKRHFLETYLHVAVNVVLAALVSGSASTDTGAAWTLALLCVAAGVVAGGVRYRRFAFVVYGVLYAYVGIVTQVVRSLRDLTAVLLFLVITAVGVIAGLIILSRRFGREE